MNWRDRVDEVLNGKNSRFARDTSLNSIATDPSVPSVPAAPPRDLLKEWGRGLAALDPERPPGGIGPRVWWQLWLDAAWLLETHGRYCSLSGWSSESLFGVDFANPPAGGLAQLLQSSRSVVFDGPRAKVRCWGVTFDRNATWAADCPLIWELGQ